jgi:hypothetical protein
MKPDKHVSQFYALPIIPENGSQACSQEMEFFTLRTLPGHDSKTQGPLWDDPYNAY